MEAPLALLLFLFSTAAHGLTVIPSGLAQHLRHQFIDALPTDAAHRAAALLEDLERLALASADGNGAEANKWAHVQGMRAAVALRRDASLRETLLAGETDLAGVLAAHEAHCKASSKMAHAIQARHKQLREAVTGGAELGKVAGADQGGILSEMGDQSVLVGDTSDAQTTPASGEGGLAVGGAAGVSASVWHDATALRSYADAAAQIGERGWARQGIDWIATESRDFLDPQGGRLRLEFRDACRGLWKAREGSSHADLLAGDSGAYSSHPDASQRDAYAAEKAKLRERVAAALTAGSPAPTPIRLLDVGSCGNLFARFDGFQVTALDLEPLSAPDAAEVFQCDFLSLRIGDEGSAAVVAAHERCKAGKLCALPRGGFDAVAMSLVLSYLPTAEQRFRMVTKARELLVCEGLSESVSESVREGMSQGAIQGTNEGSGQVNEEGAELRYGPRGVLMLVETFSVDRKARSWKEQTYLHRWVQTIEAVGFRFVKHQALARTHALMFVASHKPAMATDAHGEGLAMRVECERVPGNEWRLSN